MTVPIFEFCIALIISIILSFDLGFDNVCKEKQVSIAYQDDAGIKVKWDWVNNRAFEEMSKTGQRKVSFGPY